MGSSIELRQISENLILIDGKETKFDLKRLCDGQYSLLLEGKSFHVCHSHTSARTGQSTLDGNHLTPDPMRITMNGNEYSVVIDDERSLLLKKFLKKHHAGTSSYVMCAPMPGLISRIEVDAGQEVAKGAGLLVLEAMKMENEIRSTGAGRVRAIHVEKGTAVEKGQQLMTIDEL
jgi:biotin carboxyl carrier protein